MTQHYVHLSCANYTLPRCLHSLVSPIPQPGGKIARDDLLAFFKAARMTVDFNEIKLKSVISSDLFTTVFRGIYRYKIADPGDAGRDKKMVRVFCLLGLS